MDILKFILMKNKITLSTHIDIHLKERAMYIIQNKLNITLREFIEIKFKDLIRDYEKDK